MIRNYEIIEIIKETQKKTIYKTRNNKDNQIYVLKEIKLDDENEKNNIVKNFQNHLKLKSEYVIEAKNYFFEYNNKIVLTMEYADQGDLSQKIKGYKEINQYLSEKEIWNIFYHILKGLEDLHDKKIIHRNLQSSNILLFSDGRAKIGNLNMSIIQDERLMRDNYNFVNHCYAPPEIWKKSLYTNKIDIWSLGCILYEMITLNLPFGNERISLYHKIMNVEINKKLFPQKFSEELLEMVSILIQKNMENRPICKDILKHKYLKKRYCKDPFNVNSFLQRENMKDSSLDITIASIITQINKPIRSNRFKQSDNTGNSISNNLPVYISQEKNNEKKLIVNNSKYGYNLNNSNNSSEQYSALYTNNILNNKSSIKDPYYNDSYSNSKDKKKRETLEINGSNIIKNSNNKRINLKVFK